MDFKRCFSRIWPFSVLVFLVIIFFWRFFFKGSIPIPADIIVGMYFPWLDYKWGYTVGVPVKNSLISDVVSLFFPMKSYLISSLKNGRLPLWNPYMFGGYPFLGNIQLGIFNPTNLFYFVSPVPVAWGMQIFFQTLFCGLFIYWLLRYLKISKLSSLLGGIVYSFSGFSIIWSQWGSHVFTASFLPLLLLFSSKYLRSGKIRFGVLFSLTLALQIFSGYPQVIVYSVFAEILFVMIVEKFWQKRAIDLILFFILGITLSGIQLFPSFELLINSRRQIETINRNEAYLKNNNLISFFAPDYFGNITTGNYWGEGNYTRNSGYSGIVVVILASLAVIFIKKKEILFLLLLFVFSLSFAFPSPAAIFLNKLKFLGLGGAAGDRVLFLANFSLAALAAFGLDFLKQKYDFKVIRSLYLPTIVVFGVLTGSFLSRQSFRSFSGVATDSFSREVLEGWLRNLNVGMRNLVLPLGFILASCLLLILGVLRNSLSRLVRISFLFLVYFELVRFGWKYTPFSDRKLIFPTTPVLNYLKSQKGVFRVEGGDAVPMNMLMPYGLESFSGYDAFGTLRSTQFMSVINGGDGISAQGRFGGVEKYDNKFFDLANICYLLAVKRNEISVPDPAGIPGWKFRDKKFEKVFEDKRVVVLKNVDCLPRAILVNDFKVAKNNREIIKLISEPQFNIKKTIVLETEPDVSFDISEDDKTQKKENRLEWLTYQPNEEKISVAVDRPSFLFVSDSYFPGWEAYIDGTRTPIYRANFNFRSVAVPKGEHQIHFVYRPKTVILGSLVSVFSLTVAIFLLLKFQRRENR